MGEGERDEGGREGVMEGGGREGEDWRGEEGREEVRV